MATDPGFSNDTCIFLEAIPGDGGKQDAANVWWLSPDIKLVGPLSGQDVADGVSAAKQFFEPRVTAQRIEFRLGRKP